MDEDCPFAVILLVFDDWPANTVKHLNVSIEKNQAPEIMPHFTPISTTPKHSPLESYPTSSLKWAGRPDRPDGNGERERFPQQKLEKVYKVYPDPPSTYEEC